MEKKKIKTVVFFIGIIMMLLLFKSIGVIKLNVDDFKSHGEGKYYKSGLSSFLSSLGIMEDYDYINEETGEYYCFDNACWDEATEELELCYAGGEIEFLVNKIVSYVEIIPAVCAIGIGDDLVDACDLAYEETLISECQRRCEEEIYIWDGTLINDLGSFSEMAFPNFISNSEFACESWLMSGEWISQEDKVGCVDSLWIRCDRNSLLSAKDVCEIIGKVWTCDGINAYCSNE